MLGVFKLPEFGSGSEQQRRRIVGSVSCLSKTTNPLNSHLGNSKEDCIPKSKSSQENFKEVSRIGRVVTPKPSSGWETFSTRSPSALNTWAAFSTHPRCVPDTHLHRSRHALPLFPAHPRLAPNTCNRSTVIRFTPPASNSGVCHRLGLKGAALHSCHRTTRVLDARWKARKETRKDRRTHLRLEEQANNCRYGKTV